MNDISSITISWSVPFSLDVPGDTLGIWYTVTIYNNMTDNTEYIHNILDTNYIFTPDYPSPCHMYIFTIIPFNEVGQGQSSEGVTDSELREHDVSCCTEACRTLYHKYCIHAYTITTVTILLKAIMCIYSH